MAAKIALAAALHKWARWSEAELDAQRNVRAHALDHRVEQMELEPQGRGPERNLQSEADVPRETPFRLRIRPGNAVTAWESRAECRHFGARGPDAEGQDR